MTKKKKQNTPKINPYWLYGMVILLLLSLSFFGDGSLQSSGKTNTSAFERYLNNGDVERVVIQNEKTARIYLKATALEKADHQALKKENFLGQVNIQGPHYAFEFGDLKLFQEKLERAKAKNIEFSYEFITVENKFFDVIVRNFHKSKFSSGHLSIILENFIAICKKKKLDLVFVKMKIFIVWLS